MTDVFRATPPRHLIRRGLLHILAQVPVSRQKPPPHDRILLIRPDHLGDVLLTTPAIHALRQAHPNAEIHALVGPWSAEVLANYDTIDTVLTLPFPGFSRSEKKGWQFPYQLALQSARHLRLIGYTSAVIMRPDHWWGAMLAYLAGIPQRIGYDHIDVEPFLTRVLPQRQEHAVIKNLRLVEGWTGALNPEQITYHFHVDQKADRAYVDEYLKQWDIPVERPIFVIHPGSGTWVKRWEESSWAVVADTLTEQLGATVVFTGSDHEMYLAQSIVAQMNQPACIMVGDTQLLQLATLLKRAILVLGPDSGPLHLAAAVGTPTVALFGPADPVEFAPWGSVERHRVLTSDIGCRPCQILDWGDDSPLYHPCVKEITIGRVLDAARRAVKADSIENE